MGRPTAGFDASPPFAAGAACEPSNALSASELAIAAGLGHSFHRANFMA
jgi:hypothetical protein